MTSSQSYATFYVDNFYFGILTSDVVELTKGTEVTPVPLAPPAVSGLINLRGQIVTAIDMRKRLGLQPNLAAEDIITVFIRNNGVLFGLLIDKVSDILELDHTGLEPPPSNMPSSAYELIIGFHKLPNKLLFVMDVDKLISGCLPE
jgi:purine-binding chemotaxis protein CheW